MQKAIKTESCEEKQAARCQRAFRAERSRGAERRRGETAMPGAAETRKGVMYAATLLGCQERVPWGLFTDGNGMK
jgi:hypothetical protein